MKADSSLTIYDHPLAISRLTQLRAASTTTAHFRSQLRQIGSLLLGPVFEDLPSRPLKVETPLAPCQGSEHALPIVLVPILRAGLGLMDGLLPHLPEAVVGHLGMYRNEETLEPVSYYSKLPKETRGGFVVVLDPMLATGHSAIHAIQQLEPHEPKRIVLATILASPEGIREVREKCPEVRIVTLAVDEGLNDQGYIMPGLGDAGDRYFGT